jgi:hypothetical protein
VPFQRGPGDGIQAQHRMPVGVAPYHQGRIRKVNKALVQGVETARAVLATTPQGQAADAQFGRRLMEHQKEASVFATVFGLVDQLSDNPAARMTAQENADRASRAQMKAAA